MNSQQLFDSITALPDGMVEAAEGHRFRKTSRVLRYAGIAAAVVVAVGIAGLLSGRAPTVPRSATGGGGHIADGDGGSYMHYVGPVLPLTALDGAEGITAERSVDYDFSPYRTEMHSYEHNGQTYSYDASKRETVVTDSYVLTNETDEDRTLQLMYGAELRFNDALERLPRITVNGSETETALHAAAYSGAFADGKGQRSTSERMNLEEIRAWSGYVDLLSDGQYTASAFASLPSLDLPVTVYRIDGYTLSETDAKNPTLQISFSLTDADTVVLTYGSNGGENDFEAGRYTRIVGRVNDPRTGPLYLIFLGGDMADCVLQGYRSGGASPGEELDISAAVTRYESTMEEVLRMIVDDHFKESTGFHSRAYLYAIEGATVADAAERELLYAVAADLLCSYGALSDAPAGRYSFGMLEDVFEAYSVQRIIYQSFAVTVPAHGSVRVTVAMRKEASYDFTGAEQNTDGYDLATQLGSVLRFTAQTASVSSVDAVEILDNSFGFDPAQGVTEVVLDDAVPHYWMQVQKKR